MKIKHICSIIAVLSLMLMTGCVGYAPQPYGHYSQPMAQPYYAPRAVVPAYGGYNYGPPHPNFGWHEREFGGREHEHEHEFRDYGGYRRHDRD